MLLNKMLPSLGIDNKQQGSEYVNPILKRSFSQVFGIGDVEDPLDEGHLTSCYQKHEQKVNDYFQGRNDLLSIDISQADSLPKLLQFLGGPYTGNKHFPHLNIGKRVDNWKEIKSPNKVNPNAAGVEGRKYF